MNTASSTSDTTDSRDTTNAAKWFGEQWNQFWYTPQDARVAGRLRIAVGAMAFLYLLTFTADLRYWFGPGGVLSTQTVDVLTGATPDSATFHWSYLRFASSSTLLWTLHVFALIVSLAFMAGLGSRLTGVLTLIAVLSYVHRGPMLTGPFEPVLCFMLLYLCLAPTGQALSLDERLGWNRWLSNKLGSRANPKSAAAPLSVSCRIATRLIQVHLVGIYIIMVTNQLAGETWWNGEAAWWLATRSESRLLDVTSLLSTSVYWINGLTHLIVILELGFIVFVWHPLTRPFAVGASWLLWLLIAILTGLVTFALIMVIGNLAFAPCRLSMGKRQ